MVFLTRILGYTKKVAVAKPQRKYLRHGFLDKLRLEVKGGTGGSGLSQYGGRGGRGGDVVVKAKEGMVLKDLASYIKNKPLLSAGTGFDSSKKGILGQNGEDLIINVPAGVMVYHENGTLIGEVNQNDKTLVVALGGVGGCAETDYSGKKGEKHKIILDLKLISDVALVGFPNAGKSTLIKTVSNARPKVAAYPFTTVKPHVGKIIYPDYREITVADLPGLIEGAHKNVGMGHGFLKHLERATMLLFVIDIQGFKLSPQHLRRNCLETLLLLNKEIELYKPELLGRPAMLVLNKMDTDDAWKLYENFKPKLENLAAHLEEFDESIRPEQLLEFREIMPMSLIKRDKEEIARLKTRLRENLDKIYELEDVKIEEEMPEYRLVKKLKRQLKLAAPTLV